MLFCCSPFLLSLPPPIAKSSDLSTGIPFALFGGHAMSDLYTTTTQPSMYVPQASIVIYLYLYVQIDNNTKF